MTIISNHIMSNTHYDDAEVPFSAPLLNMAIKKTGWARIETSLVHRSSMPPTVFTHF